MHHKELYLNSHLFNNNNNNNKLSNQRFCFILLDLKLIIELKSIKIAITTLNLVKLNIWIIK